MNSENATLVDLIGTAWSVDPDKVVGGPDWLDTERFDVIATAPADSTPEALKIMLRGTSRGPLPPRGARGTRSPASLRDDGYSGSINSSLPLSEEKTGCETRQTSRATVISECRNMTMAAFAKALPGIREASGYLFNYPVADLTGLTGAWDFTLQWTPRLAMRRESRPVRAGDDLRCPREATRAEAEPHQNPHARCRGRERGRNTSQHHRTSHPLHWSLKSQTSSRMNPARPTNAAISHPARRPCAHQHDTERADLRSLGRHGSPRRSSADRNQSTTPASPSRPKPPPKKAPCAGLERASLERSRYPLHADDAARASRRSLQTRRAHRRPPASRVMPFSPRSQSSARPIPQTARAAAKAQAMTEKIRASRIPWHRG